MNQLDRWEGEFGDAYTDRNEYDPQDRLPIFRDILPSDVQYVLEVGCNMGNNLETLSELGLTAIGVEPNKKAAAIGRSKGRHILVTDAFHLPFADGSFDLVFTSGVLMHIPDYKKAMEEIWSVTRKYALAIEYTGDNETVNYHGNTDMLWKRPAYNYPGKLLKSGHLGKEFDYCTYQLFEKE